MAFVSGPRQCGKTTLAKMLLSRRASGAYYNWDDIDFRRAWTKSPRSVVAPPGKSPPLLVLDEIHKARSWKRSLKGLYDTLELPADILVTGSARLNIYRKGSDSLLGRYFHFRLHPLSLREIEMLELPNPRDLIDRVFARDLAPGRRAQQDLEAFFRFGTFPEPFLARDERKARLWRQSRVERVIREDLRDLSRIPDLSRIEMLAALLPERVGSLLSVASLRDALEVSFDTAKRWLESLKELYYVFEIKPHHESVARSLRKAGKIYLWDPGEVLEEGRRFENLVASHLLKSCHHWTDTGEGRFDLKFVRDKQGHEIDFLITREKKPWLLLEAKLDSPDPDPSWRVYLRQLPCKHGIQVVRSPGIWRVYEEAGVRLLVASAAEVLRYFC
jgi:predicted AAA+ superfamily ATPase